LSAIAKAFGFSDISALMVGLYALMCEMKAETMARQFVPRVNMAWCTSVMVASRTSNGKSYASYNGENAVLVVARRSIQRGLGTFMIRFIS